MYTVTTTSVLQKKFHQFVFSFHIVSTSEKLSFIDKNNFISKKLVWCACAVMCNVLWCSSSCLYICLWHKYYFWRALIGSLCSAPKIWRAIWFSRRQFCDVTNASPLTNQQKFYFVNKTLCRNENENFIISDYK